MDLQISELPGPYGDIGSRPGMPFPEPGDMLDVPDLWSFVDVGPKRSLPVSGETSDLPVPASMVDSGPSPLECGDRSRLLDFSGDIDPGPGEPFSRSGGILACLVFLGALDPGPGRPLPESRDMPDRPSLADDFSMGSIASEKVLSRIWKGVVDAGFIGHH